MRRFFHQIGVKSLIAFFALFPVSAMAEGIPHNWSLGLTPPSSPVQGMIYDLHNVLLWIMTAVAIFVLALLLYVIFRFNAKRNPVPSKTTHNTLIEVIWTAVPIIILIFIAFPSFRLLYTMSDTNDAAMTIKAVGHQWYWSYEYPDHGNFVFDSNMVSDAELKEGQPRLLAVDNEVVLPVNTKIRVLITASDVIHSWAVPALGIKRDGVPGRINEVWLSIDKEGMYYGQCSEICGALHGFMPIAIRAVSEDEFENWVEKAKVEFGS